MLKLRNFNLGVPHTRMFTRELVQTVFYVVLCDCCNTIKICNLPPSGLYAIGETGKDVGKVGEASVDLNSQKRSFLRTLAPGVWTHATLRHSHSQNLFLKLNSHYPIVAMSFENRRGCLC